MSYFDRELMLYAFTSKNEADILQAFASVDRAQLEKNVIQDAGDVFKPFSCTSEPIKNDPNRQVEEQDQELIEWLFHAVQGSKPEARRGLKLLQKLTTKYPNNPMLYNFKATAYQTLGKEKKQLHTIKMTCKKFPNYLFGKMALANHHLSDGLHECIPDIFDHKLQLYMHYPETEEMPVFHKSEIQGFYTVMGRYYAKAQQMHCALKCYFLVEGFGAYDHLGVLANEILTAEFMNSMKEGMQKLLTHGEVVDE